jgi:hypothetical protein
MATAESPIYDELLDLFAATADFDLLSTFRLSPQRQAQLDELLDRNRDGLLTPDERGELQEFEALEHLGRMLKARLRQKRNP